MSDEQRKMTLLEQLKQKPDIKIMIDKVMAEPEWIPVLFDIIADDRGSIKFASEKIIRLISEKQPLLVYPYFERIAQLLGSPNNFIKWGAIITVSNLIAVDRDDQFKAIYEQYFNLINDKTMVTAANVVGNTWKFIQCRHEYETDLTRRLLATAENTYFLKGEPSPECKNVLFGHLIDCFDQYFDKSGSQSAILDFVGQMQTNPRKQVAKKAGIFIKKHRHD